MGIFSKKDNGINWQKEVYEISKAIPKILEKQENMGKDQSDHVAAGRIQRTEDKIMWKELLSNSLDCARGSQIDSMQTDVDTLKSDKVESKGRFLGMKRIWVIFLAIGVVVMLVLNVMWKLRML